MLRKLVLIGAFLCIQNTCLWAKFVSFNGNDKSINIGDKIEYIKDSLGKFTIAEIVKKDAYFIPSKVYGLTFHDNFDYWMKIQIDNQSSDEIVFDLAQPVLREVDFYYYDSAKATWQLIKSGFMQDIENKIFYHQQQILPILNKKGTYYIKFKSLGASIPVKVWNKNHLGKKIGLQRIIFGIFSGLMLFVIITNLFFFITLKRYVHLHYSVLILLYFFMALTDEGYIVYLIPKFNLIYGLNVGAVYACPIGITFVMLFVQARKYAPTMFKVGVIMFIYYLSYVVWHHFLSPLNLHYFTHLHGLFIVLLMSIIALSAGKNGNKMGYYYFYFYIVFFVLAVANSLSRFIGTPPQIFYISYNSLGFLIDAIGLSYLLAMRFNIEKRAAEREKNMADQLVLEKTVENAKLVREQNIFLEKKVAERTSELEIAKQKTDDLLLNVMPEEVASELKEKGFYQARKFESVTVLFADIQGFTKLMDEKMPDEILYSLDIYFTAFDEIIEKYNLEKIKTIGDAYMCAGGVPIVSNSHAVDVVNAALEICAVVKKMEIDNNLKQLQSFQIRVGISTGEVMAGIIGKQKFAYDIWGDCVNTASRLEQHSEAGKINISESTYELIKSKFEITPRGKIDVKNKGKIEMYFVEGRK